MQYARERFWKGGTFADLEDARGQAGRWSREVAGQRVHGTTRQLPLVVFEEEERAHLQPYDGVPYDVPVWRAVTVHADHHVSFQYALYSAPFATCPPGTKLEARGDRALVKLYRRGELIKVHPRQPSGGRRTDPDDYPPEVTAYALRAPDRLVRRAQELGPSIGAFAARLLDAPMPWAKLRQGQKLLRLADRYSPARLEAACARALGFDLLDVTRLERILGLALEHEGLPVPPAAQRVRPLPPSRYARPGTAFDHRFVPTASSPPLRPRRARARRAGRGAGAMTAVDPDLVHLLKRMKLGPLGPTLPERLTLARAQQLDYAAFLTLLLADEVQRRDQQALERHLEHAGFEERVSLDHFDWSSPVHLDKPPLQHVFTLAFLAQAEHVLFVGPVGVGKTFQDFPGPGGRDRRGARRAQCALCAGRHAAQRVEPGAGRPLV